jgi:ribitol-5-phosphate 2-dehydrogenase
LYGSSRSGRLDFERVLDIFQKHPLILSYLEELVVEKIRIRKVEDIKEAFERDISTDLGKVILIWDK